MKETTELEYQRRFEEYQVAALAEPVVITKGDNFHLVLMSYEKYKNLRTKAGIQQSMYVAEFSEPDIRAIYNAKMPADREHLNEELDE